jgi:hypothetical protein
LSGDDQAQAERAAVRLAQANQRLEQEKKVFERRLERDRQLTRVQAAMSWVILIMLPAVAAACIIVFINAATLPVAVVTSASGAFFVDVVGTVIAGYKALLPARSPDELLVATTADPFAMTDTRQEPGKSAPENATPSEVTS